MAALPSRVRADLQAVEARCTARLHSQGSVPPDFVRHLDRSASRLLRPALLLLAARACGGRGDVVIQYATAVELIHRATLLHRAFTAPEGPLHPDSASQRDVAVLLGDFLYVSAMQLALAPDRQDLVRLICDATVGTFEGELYQLTTAPAGTAYTSDHVELMARATAPLFAAAAEIGARLGTADGVTARALARYGFAFGTAFHLLDQAGIDDAPVLAGQQAAEARQALAPLDASEERDALLSLLDALVPPAPQCAPEAPPLRTSRL